MAGIAFPGWASTISHLFAEAELAEKPEWALRRNGRGIHSLSRMGVGGKVRLLVREPAPGGTEEPTLGEFSAALVAEYGTD